MAFLKATLIALACGVAWIPAVAAEPWEGTWSESPDPSTCTAARGDGAPLVIMSRIVTPGAYVQFGPDGEEMPSGEKGQISFEREADPWVCYIRKITNVLALDAWIFDIECGGEGEIWRDRAVVMATDSPEGIAAYNLIGKASIQLFRCPPSSRQE